MAHIHVLPKHLADMIAAGEVVERPASVVKELVENAVDAGSTQITVEIRHGGATYIRVTDDGCGIPREEVPTAFLPHATSKLFTPADLDHIGTLGFRGEALAAIAAVSCVQMLTKPKDAPMGWSYTVVNGEAVEEGDAGCPDGTTVVVRDVFASVPARYKFLKTDAAEGAAVHAVVLREALGHPEISFRFVKDGKSVFTTAGDGQSLHALQTLLPDEARDMVEVTGGDETLGVRGFVSRPTGCRGSRAAQHFFVNGRWVKSRLIAAALENAYKNQKMVGRFPAAVLWVDLRLDRVDVNSHPAKTEVRFVEEHAVYARVFHSVEHALSGGVDQPLLTPGAVAAPVGEGTPLGDRVTFASPTVKTSPAGRWDIPPAGQKDPAGRWDIPPAGQKDPAGRWDIPPAGQKDPADRWDIPGKGEKIGGQGEQMTLSPEDPPHTGGSPSAPPLGTPPAPAAHLPSTPADPSADTPSGTPTDTPSGTPAGTPWRVVGEALKTYIIVEQGDKLLFIDKHAAHERMGFDALKSQGYRPMAQELLKPLAWRGDPQDQAAILAHAGDLEAFGFRLEDLGNGTVVVRAAPDYLNYEDISSTLEDLARQYRAAADPDPDAQRDDLMHTMACKAAMKGGQKNREEELLVIAKAVMEGTVTHCPHGRPVATQLTRAQLERQFGRS